LYREQIIGQTEPSGSDSSDKAVIVIPCLNERAHIGDLISWILQDTASLTA